MITDLDMSPAACVARGVEFLDADFPGWRDEVDPDILNIANGETCMFGQLYGDYGRKALEMMAEGLHPGAYGFAAFSYNAPLQALNDEWRQAIHGSPVAVPA